MTRPLEQLEQASRQIAAGAYSQRTAIHGSDEIASLSRSFDEMAQAVEGTVQTLQQNARQKDDFVAAFTHELKTPMTSILGFADILRSGEVSPATRRTAADYIYHESKRLEALSGNLLGFDGAGTTAPAAGSPYPWAVCCKACAVPCLRAARCPPYPAVTPWCWPSRNCCAICCTNLIQNARKATPADGKVEVLLDENTHPADHPRTGYRLRHSAAGTGPHYRAVLYGR